MAPITDICLKLKTIISQIPIVVSIILFWSACFININSFINVNSIIIYIYNIQIFIYLYTTLFLRKYVIVLFILIPMNNWLNEYYNIMKRWYFLMGKELYESILIFPKLWLILFILSLFLLMRYLTLSQILLNNP